MSNVKEILKELRTEIEILSEAGTPDSYIAIFAKAADTIESMIRNQLEIYVLPMTLTDGRTDYYVVFRCDDRHVTPHVFREQYKAEYHVALYNWMLNGGEPPDILAFNENDWPAKKIDVPNQEWCCPKCGAQADERYDCCEVHQQTNDYEKEQIIRDLRHAASNRADVLQRTAAIDAAIAFLSRPALALDTSKLLQRLEEIGSRYFHGIDYQQTPNPNRDGEEAAATIVSLQNEIARLDGVVRAQNYDYERACDERDEYKDKWEAIMLDEEAARKTYLLHTEKLMAEVEQMKELLARADRDTYR